AAPPIEPWKGRSMSDPNDKDLPGDAEEVDTDTEGDATEPEDLTGLKSALGRLKDDRKVLKQKLADALTENAFLVSLPKGVQNPKAVRALAREFGMIKDDGTLDAEAFKKEFPQLLTTATPP